jgi:hypothetical protein
MLLELSDQSVRHSKFSASSRFSATNGRNGSTATDFTCGLVCGAISPQIESPETQRDNGRQRDCHLRAQVTSSFLRDPRLALFNFASGGALYRDRCGCALADENL